MYDFAVGVRPISTIILCFQDVEYASLAKILKSRRIQLFDLWVLPALLTFFCTLQYLDLYAAFAIPTAYHQEHFFSWLSNPYHRLGSEYHLVHNRVLFCPRFGSQYLAAVRVLNQMIALRI